MTVTKYNKPMSFIQKLLTGVNNILQPQQGWLSDFSAHRLQFARLAIGVRHTDNGNVILFQGY